MGGAPSIPQVDPGAVLAAIRQNLGPMVQKQYGLARDYGPKFAEQDIKQSQKYAPQYAQLGLDLTNQFGPQYAQAGYDISKQFAPQYLGLNLGQMQSAIKGSPLLSSLNTQAQAGLASQGVDPLLGQLTTQAQEQLGQKGHLTAQEAYQQTQGTLGSFAGRNNVFNQAEAQSFLDRDKLVRQRMQEGQQFAGNVEAQRQGALGLAQNFGLSTQAANLQNLQGLGGVAQTPNFAGYAQSPNLAAYGAPGSSYTPMSTGIGATSGTVQQIAPIVSEIFGSNQSAAANQAIGGANKQSGMIGGGLAAAGTIAAAAL